ncbi:hypothetical protein AVEN_205374-1 [Araneus ventricosus]|uniref:Uncharacterized protein n=1 Tax=Araneus ventricosus TaxID=182803 RepID=A0A4Y2TED4_ARAVE|nr:hypothetical protein AVEN_205374-1 [Araneus ventricosus]
MINCSLFFPPPLKEREIQRLQYIHQDYDHKCKEVTMLQEQLFQAKKGKKATWLGNITRQSVTQSSSSTSPEDKTASMLEAFLSDSADESFGNDENDPDWRLTPAYKRQKELRAKKEGRKRRLAEEARNLLGLANMYVVNDVLFHDVLGCIILDGAATSTTILSLPGPSKPVADRGSSSSLGK